MGMQFRPCVHGTATIDVSLLEEIEGTLAIDCAAPPDVIAPLIARARAHEDARRDPEHDEALCADVRKVMDGEWLHVEEIHAIQRLRGWHRARYGRITVDAYWLADVRNVLETLTMALGSTCDEEIEELRYPGNEDILATAEALMEATGYCGECRWCTVLRLRDETDRALDAAGYEGGVYYRTLSLGQSVAQANREVYGYCIFCGTYGNACTDPEHLAAASAVQEVA